MRFNLPYCTSEFAEIGRVLGVATASQSETEQARAGIARIEELIAAVGAPLDLKAIDIKPEHFGVVADSSLKASRLVLNNPAPMNVENVTALLKRGYDDDRSWWSAP
jgi:alcohol dehydrogenase class IV